MNSENVKLREEVLSKVFLNISLKYRQRLSEAISETEEVLIQVKNEMMQNVPEIEQIQIQDIVFEAYKDITSMLQDSYHESLLKIQKTLKVSKNINNNSL